MNQQEYTIEVLLKKALPGDDEEWVGYDAPFAAFTWEAWQQMQARMLQNNARFLRAIEHKQAKVAVEVANEVIQMGLIMLDEAKMWIGIKPE